jgi:hypothetical protein
MWKAPVISAYAAAAGITLFQYLFLSSDFSVWNLFINLTLASVAAGLGAFISQAGR